MNDNDYTLKPSEEPFLYRYPYDFSYSDVSASWDGTFATSGFWGSPINDLDWFPDGNKLVVVGTPHTNNGIVGRIYSLSDNGTALYGDGAYTITWGGTNTLFTLTTVAVHPEGRYLAVGGIRTPGSTPKTHRLIYFDDTNTTTVIATDFDHGSTVQSVAWSPDGNYLAVAGNTSSSINLRIYRLEYGSLIELTRCRYFWSTTNPLYSVAWHPTGNYLAVGGGISASSHTVKVLHFTNESISELLGARTTNGITAGYVSSLSWNDEGTKLAVAHHSDSTNPKVYSFINGLRLTLYSAGSTSATQFPSVSWSPDGAYLSFARPTQIDTYTSYDNAGSLSNITGLNFGIETIRKIRWNPDGNFLAIGTNDNGAFGAPLSIIMILRINENTAHLSKRLQKELFALYNSAKSINSITTNNLKPLVKANSSSLASLLTDVTPSYSLFQIIPVIHSSEGGYCCDFTNDNQFMIVGYNYTSVKPYEGTHLFKKNNVTDKYEFYASVPSNHIYDSVKSTRFSPNNKYFVTMGMSAGGPQQYIHIFSFNEHSFTLKYFAYTANRYHHIQWFPDSSTLLHERGIHSFNGSTLTEIDSTYRISPSLDSTGKYFAYISSPNTLTVAKYQGTTVTTVTSTPVSNLSSLNFCTWENPSKIALIKSSSPYGAAVYNFDGTSLTLVGTTALPSQMYPDELKSCKLNKTGEFLLISLYNSTVSEYKVNAPSGPLVQTEIFSSNGFSCNYAKNDEYIIDPTISGVIYIHKRTLPFSLSNTYTILKGTSDLLAGGISSGDNSLNIETSNAIINQAALSIDNSNVLVTKDALIKANSNAIAGLLVETSNAINNFVIPNSQTLVTIKTKVTNNSNALVTIDALARANSNAIVTYQSLIVQNSTAISGLLVDTSNATAGLLVATSNAIAELLVDTSNAAYANALKLTSLATIDTAESHIHFNSASITMTYNLNLSTDHQLFVHTSGVVNGNGHSITLARGAGTQITVDPGITTTFQNVIFKDYNDQAVSLGAGASFIFGNQSRVELSEPQTLLRTWSFAGISQLNGLGNTLTLGSGPLFLSSLISSTLQLSNLNLLNVRENNIRAANNNSAINFQDVTLNMSADYTFSIGSITVQNDLTLHGTSIFNYTTIMGLTINPASQLTVDQGMKFNYAPAGNFRNLLSLTDSSARLYFNNATLVATATGPRLTKGTLIVDGIMNIQSAAASSAEAVIFGDLTPANDLILNIMPEARLNVQTGFLNYANAN